MHINLSKRMWINISKHTYDNSMPFFGIYGSSRQRAILNADGTTELERWTVKMYFGTVRIDIVINRKEPKLAPLNPSPNDEANWVNKVRKTAKLRELSGGKFKVEFTVDDSKLAEFREDTRSLYMTLILEKAFWLFNGHIGVEGGTHIKPDQRGVNPLNPNKIN